VNIPNEHIHTCRAGCGQDVVLAITARVKGEPKWTPLDPKPSEAGRYLISRHDDDRKGHYEAVKITRPAQLAGVLASGQTLHTSHGVTCPNKDRYARIHRGKKL
jgi:hypothetical protein